MGVMRPELVMKSIVPVVMAGVLGIYGLIIAVIISTGGEELGHSSLTSGLPAAARHAQGLCFPPVSICCCSRLVLATAGTSCVACSSKPCYTRVGTYGNTLREPVLTVTIMACLCPLLQSPPASTPSLMALPT
jgi:hypothetical protein